MPIIDAAGILADAIGPTVNTGDIGLPETPDNWGSEQGGYVNDLGTGGPGGFTNSSGIYRIFPWWESIAEKTYNPNGANFRVQVRLMRAYLRNKSPLAWALQQTINDPNFDSGGGGAANDYRFPGDVNYQYNETSHGGFSGRLVSMSSGGSAVQHINDWCLHGWPMNMINPNYTTQDCVGVTMQMRLVPLNDANDFDPDSYRVSGNVGCDNYGGGWVAATGQGALKRITHLWQVFAWACVKSPDRLPNQGPGLTVAQYNSAPLPIPPEEHVWLERGAFNSTTNKQTLVLRRSASVSAPKTYSVSKRRGSVTVPMSNVTIAAGQSSVQFDVDTPGGAVAGRNTLYFSDGNAGTSMEDHWGVFTIGTGSATGSPGGGTTAVPATLSGTGVNVSALLAAAASQPSGQRGLKYSGDVSNLLGSFPIVEVIVGGIVRYRTTVNGSLSYSASGIAIPSQFNEPPSVNQVDALTSADSKIRFRPASGADVALDVNVNVNTIVGALKIDKGLNGSRVLRMSGVVIRPPASVAT